MNKVTVILLFFVCLIANAQSPQLNVKGSDSLQVKMSQMIVNVKVVGNIAYTTAEMHFFNSSSRQMEAELLFPLPEGVSVSRYSIDINGKMREAVPVNKSKGKQVFEAVEHRRVDPGLLEKVDGNNFKTRIYPLMPNAERIVIIGYEQELTGFDKSNLSYQLVSRFPQKLDKFEVNINVLGAVSKPIVAGDSSSEITFDETTWNKSFQTSIKKANYQPTEKLTIKIPIQEEIPSVVVQSVGDQHYFYANTTIEGNKIHKKNPDLIGLIWDVSLSCKNRDLKKELGLLDAYFKEIKNTKVSLYFLSYNFEFQKSFNIENGNWAELRMQLETAKYDGGTRFSQIKFDGVDEYLFFTDGLSSLSDNQLTKTKAPIYTITSSASSDYAFLNYSSLKTGANLINLNNLNVEKALDKLVFQTLKFLGIKDNYTVTDLYPIAGTPVSGNFSVAGISLNPQNEITLLFGYDDKIILEKKITIDAKNQTSDEVNIEKLWAQKKIANLEIQYKKNAEEIEILGNKFGIITQNTSLIVLESLADYIKYDIVPPTELRVEFDRIKKQQHDAQVGVETSNWKNIQQYHDVLNTWWKRNIKFTEPKVVVNNKPKMDRMRLVRPSPVQSEERINGDAIGAVGYVSSPPNVQHSLEGKVAGLEITTTSSRNQAEMYKKDAASKAEYNADDKSFAEKEKELQSVVVVSNPNTIRRTRNAVTSSTQTITSREIYANVPNSLQGRVSGVTVTDSDGKKIVSDSISNPAEPKWSNDTKVTSWNPDRLYLKPLKLAPKELKYEVYLKLRENQFTNPNFYFDVANYFYNNGDKQKALLVLSNIADLGLENHQLYKSLTYVLRQWESFEDALYIANQVVKWRAFEPQSHRDLGLTLEDNKQYQAAFDTLIKGLEVNYYGEMSGHYQGVEDIILMDLNRMISEHSNLKTDKLDKKYLNKMPVVVRIILNWNQADTDIDLHVIEPTGEECYYSHTDTEIGARFSKDFTQGYGPEQYLLRNTVKGKYQIRTNFFGESTLTENGPTTVMVEVYTQKNGKTTRKLQTIQLGKIKENQNLAVITID
jgi:Vault protein inter-alpha-trypsin domain